MLASTTSKGAALSGVKLIDFSQEERTHGKMQETAIKNRFINAGIKKIPFSIQRKGLKVCLE
jgi:hypothetical protein